MGKNRYTEWIDNSDGLRYVDLLLIGNAQGLGILDVELIQEFPKIRIDSQLEEDRQKKLRHITLSELWVMGAYELIRLIDNIIQNDKDTFSRETKQKLKDKLSIFTQVRIPLVKFKQRGKNELYSGITVPKFDLVNGLGWKIHYSNKSKIETKEVLRKDLGDDLLELLKSINIDIHKKYYSAHN